MYQPQCEMLIPHNATTMELGGPSHNNTTSMAYSDSALMMSNFYTNIPTIASGDMNTNFHLLQASNDLHSLDVKADTNYFVGEPVQLDQLSPHQMAMLKEYYSSVMQSSHDHQSGYIHGSRNGGGGSLVFGSSTVDHEGYMLDSQQLVASPNGRRKGQKRGGGGFNNVGVQKKEKQRRERLNTKYDDLMVLIPNKTKENRAEIISDAIDYIRELNRTVDELTLLVEKKRRRKEIGGAIDMECSSVKPCTDNEHGDIGLKGELRSTYVQRKSKETFVDVRIVEDEVNIKLTKRRKDGCLVATSRALDELRLEVMHLSGGKIGDFHIYMFNTKIHPGSSVFASEVARKLIDVVGD